MKNNSTFSRSVATRREDTILLKDLSSDTCKIKEEKKKMGVGGRKQKKKRKREEEEETIKRRREEYEEV